MSLIIFWIFAMIFALVFNYAFMVFTDYDDD